MANKLRNKLRLLLLLPLHACRWWDAEPYDVPATLITPAATHCSVAPVQFTVKTDWTAALVATLEGRESVTLTRAGKGPGTLSFSAEVGPSLAGRYALVLSAAGAKSARFEDVLTIVAPPVVSAVEGGLGCASASGGLAAGFAITVRGSALSGVKASLASSNGTATPLAAVVNADGSLLLTIPQTLGLGQYALVLTPSDAVCPALKRDNAVTIAAPAALASAQSAPRLSASAITSDGELSPQNASVTVRVSGSGFSAVTRASIAAVGAQSIAPSADGTRFDAVFAAGALPVGGPFPVQVQQGGCAVQSIGAVRIAAPTLKTPSFNPNALTLANGALLDIAGTGGEAEIAIDGDASPLGTAWFELTRQATLDASAHLYRMQLQSVPSTLKTPLQSGFYDVRVRTASGEIYLQAGLFLSAEALPRIVAKDGDTLDPTGDTIRIYGCGLDAAGLSYQLVRRDGTLAATLSATAGAKTFAKFASANFRCRAGASATGAADASVSLSPSAKLEPGVYRLRVVKSVAAAAGSALQYQHDDLYPTLVYSAAPLLHAASSAAPLFDAFTPEPQKGGPIGRRNPQAVIGYDPLGQKFLYVVGGDPDDSPSVNPVSVSNSVINAPSYDHAPLTPDHALGPFVTSSSTGTTQFPLICSGGASGGACATSGTKLTWAYAPAIVADGSRLYWLGGTEDGTADKTHPEILTTSISAGGVLGEWSVSGKSLKSATFGLRAEKLVDQDTGVRTLIASGGAAPSATAAGRDGITDVTVVTLSDTGLVASAAPSATSLPRGQAFAASAAARTQAFLVGGIIDSDSLSPTSTYYTETTPKTPSLRLSVTGVITNDGIAALLPDNLWSYGFFMAGKGLFLLGGLSYSTSIDMLSSGLRVGDGGSASAAVKLPSDNLRRKRAMMAVAHAAPKLYVIGGIACDDGLPTHADTCGGGRGLSVYLAGSTSTPNSAYMELGELTP